MEFSPDADHHAIRDLAARICADFSLDYWLEKDRHGGFPDDFHQAFAKSGLLGVAMPVEYGGSGLGIAEAATIMETISRSGAGLAGASAVHFNIFGLHPLVVCGSDAQKRRWLPLSIAGTDRACFAVTEPDADRFPFKRSHPNRHQGNFSCFVKDQRDCRATVWQSGDGGDADAPTGEPPHASRDSCAVSSTANIRRASAASIAPCAIASGTVLAHSRR